MPLLYQAVLKAPLLLLLFVWGAWSLALGRFCMAPLIDLRGRKARLVGLVMILLAAVALEGSGVGKEIALPDRIAKQETNARLELVKIEQQERPLKKEFQEATEHFVREHGRGDEGFGEALQRRDQIVESWQELQARKRQLSQVIRSSASAQHVATEEMRAMEFGALGLAASLVGAWLLSRLGRSKLPQQAL